MSNNNVSASDLRQSLRELVAWETITKEQALEIGKWHGVRVFPQTASFDALLYNSGLGFAYGTYFFQNDTGTNEPVILLDVLKDQGFRWRGGTKVKVTIEEVLD